MGLDSKGLLSPFSLITSLITGMGFPLIGSLLILDIKTNHSFYLIGLILTMIGGFIAHWLLAHSTHDYYKQFNGKRKTFSKNSLKIILPKDINNYKFIKIFWVL